MNFVRASHVAAKTIVTENMSVVYPDTFLNGTRLLMKMIISAQSQTGVWHHYIVREHRLEYTIMALHICRFLRIGLTLTVHTGLDLSSGGSVKDIYLLMN
jgi:hypothetical protein